VSLTDLRRREAYARIADLVGPAIVPPRLGTIALRDEQRHAVARVALAMSRHGGCLLADDVGRGKTYVALAVARDWREPLIAVPASLRGAWLGAMARAGVRGALVSHEALSRGKPPSTEPDGVIVDESHRFRSVGTKRYDALVRLTSRAPLLLLSATPLQNGASDLRAQLALFLGERAWHLPEDSLARYLVRGAAADDALLPRVADPRWVTPDADDGAVLRTILALPPPPRPMDGGDAGLLRTLALVRAWASSRAALRAMLRRRRQIAVAFEQSAAVGRVPEKGELRTWRCEGADVQLGFASLLVSLSSAPDSLGALERAAVEERSALETVERAMKGRPDPDVARVEALLAVRAGHPAERVLAFSEYASTVRTYFAAMRAQPGVGMLTAADACIASGRLSRAALLARFAPRALGAPEPRARERVSLLLTTDLLSEGMNLQDASVVVHLDLPWNPARLAQRVGRVRRPGGASVVHSYLMSPPAQSLQLFDVEARLRRKLARAERAIGRGLPVVPCLSSASAMAIEPPRDPPVSVEGELSAEEHGEIAVRLARWLRRRSRAAPTRAAFIAAVRSPRQGWLAGLADGSLLAAVDGTSPDDHALRQLSTLLDLPGQPVCAMAQRRALAEIQRWHEARSVMEDCGIDMPATALQIAMHRRLSAMLARAPRHERATLASLAGEVRLALRETRPLGAERQLAALLEEPSTVSGDVAWLVRARDLLRARWPAARRHTSADGANGAVAVLVLFGPAA
jgi:hypothetical protein